MARSELIGSWFNSGYYGHFRCKSRNDINCEYRHLAKPSPPATFVRRIKDRPDRHLFSRHDNRQSFLNDALYFEEGLGRKRFGREANIVNRDFLAWMPHKPDLERAGPQFSTYKGDFNTIEHQKLVGKIPSSFDNDNNEVTTYGYAYGTGNPNKPVINMMCNDRLLLPCTLEGTRPAPKPKWNSHGSVANCLVWHTPTPPLVKPVMMTMEASSEVAAPKPPSEKRPVTVHAMHCDYVSPPIIAA